MHLGSLQSRALKLKFTSWHFIRKWSQEAEMSHRRSETRKEGQPRKGARSHLPLIWIPEHRSHCRLVHCWRAGFQGPIKSNRVTRFVLPLRRPWNLCPSEPAHTAAKGWRPLNLGQPVWLHYLPASRLSGHWFIRSLMHLGGILPRSLVALSGWNGPNYLLIHITQAKSSFKQRSWTNKPQHNLQMVSKHLKDISFLIKIFQLKMIWFQMLRFKDEINRWKLLGKLFRNFSESFLLTLTSGIWGDPITSVSVFWQLIEFWWY